MSLLLLCNDREVLGPWVNRRRLNVLAVFIVAALLLLSGILMATTLLPNLEVVTVTECLTTGGIVLVVTTVGVLKLSARRSRVAPDPTRARAGPDRMQWRMPPLALLEPVNCPWERDSACLPSAATT